MAGETRPGALRVQWEFTRDAAYVMNEAMTIFARLSAALAFLAALLAAQTAVAQVYTQAGFEAYLAQVASKARAEGVSGSAIRQGLDGLTINNRVVELDRPQAPDSPGSSYPPFAPYRERHVDAARIGGGQRTYAASASLIPSIEQRYGVPGEILIAIWGHETNYGSYTGGFDTIRSLATLAYEGRRRELFESELIAALKMLDRGVTRQQLTGSWAGAIGNPQFLPSVWLKVAQDGDNNGTRDIWNSRADTLASIANYFVEAGWRRGEPWGVPGLCSGQFQSLLECQQAERAALRAGVRTPRPVEDRARVEGAGHSSARRDPGRQLRLPVRTGRPGRDRLSSDQQLPGDIGL